MNDLILLSASALAAARDRVEPSGKSDGRGKPSSVVPFI